MKMKESEFQHKLISEIKERFPGSIVLKNDASYIQGIPDLTVFYEDHWATLECKNAPTAHHQPNQDYYVSKMDDMSFSRFVYPENKEMTLHEMESAFGLERETCLYGGIFPALVKRRFPETDYTIYQQLCAEYWNNDP